MKVKGHASPNNDIIDLQGMYNSKFLWSLVSCMSSYFWPQVNPRVRGHLKSKVLWAQNHKITPFSNFFGKASYSGKSYEDFQSKMLDVNKDTDL